MPIRRLLTLLALGALAVSLSACQIVSSVSGPRSWTMAAGNGDGSQSVTNVRDASGKVQSVEFDPEDAVAGGGVVPVAGQPNQLDVPWTGGSCDKQVDIGIEGAGAGLVVNVKVTPDDSKPCDAMGVLHTLRLTLSEPLAPAAVAVRQ